MNPVKMMRWKSQILFFSLSGLLALMLLIPGCLTMSKTGSPTQFSPQVTTETIPHSEDSLSFNYSDVYVASGTNLTTNGSYVARIALADPRAQQLLKYGGKIEGIDSLMTPCRPEFYDCSVYPDVVIKYGNFEYRLKVNEERGKVIRGYTFGMNNTRDLTATGPDYYQVQSGDNYSIYNGSTLYMIYNDSSILYVKPISYNESIGPIVVPTLWHSWS